MADYVADINISDYLYIREVTITEKSGEDQTDLPIKLQLNSSNFNFNFLNGAVVGSHRVNFEKMAHWSSSAFGGYPKYCSDGDRSTYLRIRYNLPAWWKVDLGSGNAQRIAGVTLRRGGTGGDTTVMIKDFRVSGSNDNSYWVLLYNGTAVQSADAQTFIFDVQPENYRYYKVDILSNYGHEYTDIGVINLLEAFGDIHVGEKADGTYILNRWIARCDYIKEEADIYFKLPYLTSNEIKNLYVYWGNPTGSGVSDIHSVGFTFSDHFDDSTTYSINWSQGGNVDVYTYFESSEVCLINQNNTTGYIQTKTDPIQPLSSWVAEIGFWMYEQDDIRATWIYSHIISFWGSGLNEARCYFAADGEGGGYITEEEEWGTYGPRTENFQYIGAAYPTNYLAHLWGSLVLDSYHQHLFGYYLPTDTSYYGMYGRDVSKISSSCPDFWKGDYIESQERRISGNSDHTRLRIWGARRGGYAEWAGTEVYMDWVIIRKFLGPYEPEWDLSNLYTDVAQINPDPLAFEFGPDLTHVNYEHTTTSGGTPAKLSNDAHGVLSDIWCSDDDAASGTGVDLVINYAAYGNELTDVEYLHYDDGHVLWLNASKLSDEDTDIHGNTYWNSTTTSGWACIDFGASLYAVGSLSIKTVSSKPNGAPKNYKIEGSFVYTNEWEDEYWYVLKEGQFAQSEGWQNAIFENSVPYRFYRLKVFDTYGDNIAIQEWKMYEYNENNSQKVVSKLRLKPASFDSQYLYFPQQIEFYGSNNLYDWTILISTKNTYTPHGGQWQEYSFTNTDPFYHYKLKAIGNWNDNAGKICIAEWEMNEKIFESYTYRITAGSHNNFSSIWAELGSTFDNLELYIVNDVISYIENERLVATKTFTGSPTDLNVGG